jgi:hypothetical protein
VWEDDDIYLPWRISHSVKHMKNGMFHTNQGYYEEQPGKDLKLSRNLFHCNLAINKDYFWSVGGYPEDRDKGDVDVDIFNKLNIESSELLQEDVFYIYRWSGTGSYHASQYDGQGEGVSGYAAEQINTQVDAGECPSGLIKLNPHWSNPWLQLVNDAVRNI